MKQLSWSFPRLIAHRGGGALAPENTLAAMKVGREAGYTAVEFDVKLSADGVAILLHDPVLGRTAPGSASVQSLNYDELASLDAGGWHSTPFVGEPIPRFSIIADWLQRHGMLANVEIKPCAGREHETGVIIGGLCRDLWLLADSQPLVSSFSLEALRATRTVAPGLLIGLLVKDIEARHFEYLDELNCVALHCHHALLTAEHVKAVHARGFKLLTYTVNDVDRARTLLQWGVDGLFTDRLVEMRAAFSDDISVR